MRPKEYAADFMSSVSVAPVAFSAAEPCSAASASNSAARAATKSSAPQASAA